MNRFAFVGLGAAVVAVALVIGTQALRPSPPGNVAGAPSAPPLVTPAPTATARPSPSPISAPPLTQTFTSPIHGISLSYPEGWTVFRTATETWTDRPGVPQFLHPGIDMLSTPDIDELFLAIASQPIGDSTPEGWVAARMADFECSTTEPIAVDGASGRIGADCRFAVFTTAGRGYWIQLYRLGEDFSSDPSDPFDRAWFEEILATVQLHPEDAVDVAPSALPSP